MQRKLRKWIGNDVFRRKEFDIYDENDEMLIDDIDGYIDHENDYKFILSLHIQLQQ